MPFLFTLLMGFGLAEGVSWRVAMVIAGAVCFFTGIAYYKLTTDAPDGNFKDLRQRGEMPDKKESKGSFAEAAKDYRVWILFLIYAACFGVELTVNNVAALYFIDYFGLSLTTAGIVAALFGLMNICARTLGGLFGDKFGIKWGLKGRVRWLMMILALEGVALICFSRMDVLPIAIANLVVFSLCVQMSEGATFSVVPFINRKCIGAVSGIVGAGGNVGAVSAGFLFKGSFEWPDAFLIMGISVFCISFLVPTIRFSASVERSTKVEIDEILRKKREMAMAAN